MTVPARQWRDAKARLERGERLPDYGREPRPFFCRTCGAETVSAAAPAGWYTRSRAAGAPGTGKNQRLGLYCSLDCFCEQLPRLAGIERDLGSRGEDRS